MGLTFFLIAIVLAFYGLFMAAVLKKYHERALI